MTMTYEVPGIDDDAKGAFETVMADMNTICKDAADDESAKVAFAVARPKDTAELETLQFYSFIDDIAGEVVKQSFDVVTKVAGKTTITLQGVCYVPP